jgi:hypothetical protein
MRSSFLDRFHRDLLPHLLEYARAISDADVDVLMFTARKAACLFDAMRTVGLVKPQGAVVSDRVLDMDLRWLEGKRVALIDDVLITGSSLYKARERLIEEARVASVRTVVLAVDREWWVPDLIEPDSSFAILDDRVAIQLCAQIVEALSTVPRPYNLDWPICEGIRVDRQHTHALSSTARWAQTETTSLLQHGIGVRTITHDLRSAYVAELEGELGLPLREARLVKVRLYGRASQRDFRFMALPMLSFGDMPVESVDELFELVTKKVNPISARQFLSATSRMRLVQFVVSARLGRVWAADVQQTLPAEIDLRFARKQLAFAFPPQVEADVIRVAREDTDLSEVQWGESALPRPQDEVRLTVASQAILNAQFVEMYHEKEIPAREEFKRHGREALVHPDAYGVLSRLNDGISLDHLEEHIFNLYAGDVDLRRVVSSFVDIAVDRGVAVPLTIEADGYVRRVYRHGEDVLFSEVAQQMFALMLSQALQSRGSNSLPRLETEKLCVLLLRIAHRKGLLSPWTGGTRDQRDYVGVRYDLKGAVVKLRLSESDSLFEYTPEVRSLTKVLTDSKLLENVDGRYRPASRLDRVPIGTDGQRLARQVGRLFGELLSPNPPVPFDVTDLTLLATCEEPHHVAAALAAEIDLIYRGIEMLLKQFHVEAQNGTVRGHARTVANRVVEAAASGVLKYRAHHDHHVDKTIQRVSNGLGDWERDAWDSFWSSRRGTESPVTEVVINSGEWLTVMLAHIRTGRLAVQVARARRGLPVAKFDEVREKIRSEAEILSRSRGLRATTLLQEIDKMQLDPLVAINTVTHVRDEIVKLMRFATALLDKTHASIDRWGQPSTWLEFNGVLLVDLSAYKNLEPTWLRKAVDRECYRATERGYALRRFRVPSAPQLLVIAARGRDRGGPVALAVRLASIRRGPLRMVLVPELADADHIYADMQAQEPQGRGFVHLCLSSVHLIRLAPEDGLITLGSDTSLDAARRQVQASGVTVGIWEPTAESPSGYQAEAIRFQPKENTSMHDQTDRGDERNAKPSRVTYTTNVYGNANVVQGPVNSPTMQVAVGDLSGLMEALKSLGVDQAGRDEAQAVIAATPSERDDRLRRFGQQLRAGAFAIATAATGDLLATEVERLIRQFLGG